MLIILHLFKHCMGQFKHFVTYLREVSDFHEQNRHEAVLFNVISATRGWVDVKYPGKNVTLEWPL